MAGRVSGPALPSSQPSVKPTPIFPFLPFSLFLTPLSFCFPPSICDWETGKSRVNSVSVSIALKGRWPIDRRGNDVPCGVCIYSFKNLQCDSSVGSDVKKPNSCLQVCSSSIFSNIVQDIPWLPGSRCSTSPPRVKPVSASPFVSRGSLAMFTKRATLVCQFRGSFLMLLCF